MLGATSQQTVDSYGQSAISKNSKATKQMNLDTTGRRRQGLDDPARGADVGKGHFMSRVLFQGNFEEQNSEATVGDISQKV